MCALEKVCHWNAYYEEKEEKEGDTRVETDAVREHKTHDPAVV